MHVVAARALTQSALGEAIDRTSTNTTHDVGSRRLNYTNTVIMQQLPGRPLVPIGYRFDPTPAELIRHYLNPWVLAGSTADHAPCLFAPGIVCVADVYAADPGALTARFRDAGHDGGNWYFLCVARWKGGKAGSRMSRRVRGGGTWHGSSKRRPVVAGGVVEGHRQGFEFRGPGGNGKDGKGKAAAWIMEEYVTSLAEATDGEGVKVLCRVRRSPRAPSTAREDDGDGMEEEEETNNKGAVVVGQHNNNNELMLPHGAYDDDVAEPSYTYNIASTSSSPSTSASYHGGLLMGGAPAEAGAGHKRPRLDWEQQAATLGACSSAPPPPPIEYYHAAGTSSQGATAACWQQPMHGTGVVVNGGGLDIGDQQELCLPPPVALDQSATGTEEQWPQLPPLADLDDLDWQVNLDEWLNNDEVQASKGTGDDGGVKDGHDPTTAI